MKKKLIEMSNNASKAIILKLLQTKDYILDPRKEIQEVKRTNHQFHIGENIIGTVYAFIQSIRSTADLMICIEASAPEGISLSLQEVIEDVLNNK